MNNLNRIGNPLSVSVNALADGWLHGREEMLALEDAGVMQNYSISVTEAERSNNLGAFENSESEFFTFITVHFHLILLITSLDHQNITSYQKDSNHKTILYFILNFSTYQYMTVHNAFQSAVLQKETAVLRSQCTKLQVLTLLEHALIIKPYLQLLFFYHFDLLPCFVLESNLLLYVIFPSVQILTHTHTLTHSRKHVLMHIYMHKVIYAHTHNYNHTNTLLSPSPSPLLQAGCADLNRQLDSSTLRVLQLEQLVRTPCLFLFLCTFFFFSTFSIHVILRYITFLSLLLHLFAIILVLFSSALFSVLFITFNCHN